MLISNLNLKINLILPTMSQQFDYKPFICFVYYMVLLSKTTFSCVFNLIFRFLLRIQFGYRPVCFCVIYYSALNVIMCSSDQSLNCSSHFIYADLSVQNLMKLKPNCFKSNPPGYILNKLKQMAFYTIL